MHGVENETRSNGTHTPGPWALETVKTSSGLCHKIGPFPWRNGKDNHACIYVDYPNGAMGPLEAELKANASLIAAAPELLQATVALYTLLATDARYEGGECMDLALAAITKAFGEA